MTFEKPTAANTAQLLNNTQLGGAQIAVTPADGGAADQDHSAGATGATTNASRDTDEITQEEKPRSRILAEYLAHGYVVADAALQRAIELDHSHGVTERFRKTLTTLDAKYHATDKARATDPATRHPSTSPLRRRRPLPRENRPSRPWVYPSPTSPPPRPPCPSL